MRALVVVNPVATGTRPRTRDALLRTLSGELKLDVVETQYRGHGCDLGVQAATEGVDVVVTFGGDGTVNEVVNGLLQDGPSAHLPAVAVVPGGSTNVFSRALGRSRNPVTAAGEILASLHAGRTRRISLGTASALAPDAEGTGWAAPRWFVFTAGLGFDAEVIARVEARRRAGRRSTGALYVAETTLTFLRGRERRRPALCLQIPGEPRRDGLFLCLVSNVSPWTYLGNRPVNPSPESSFDTRLDVFALAGMGALRMIDTARQTLARRADPHGRSIYRWHDLPGLTVTADRPLDWQLDGDHLGSACGLRLASVPGALRVVV